jgi:hypothetical protein
MVPVTAWNRLAAYKQPFGEIQRRPVHQFQKWISSNFSNLRSLTPKRLAHGRYPEIERSFVHRPVMFSLGVPRSAEYHPGAGRGRASVSEKNPESAANKVGWCERGRLGGVSLHCV